MKLITWNVNGLRSVAGKGFVDWFGAQNADLVCLQEIKAKPEQLPEGLRQIPGYTSVFTCAARPGYSGLVTYSKREPLEIIHGMGVPEIDQEARVQACVFPEFTLVNVYMPHARRDLSRKSYKLAFCDQFVAWATALQEKGHRLVICGDYNISHQEIDLTNPKANRQNAGFLPEERAWMDTFIGLGLCDIFRDTHPGEPGHYTWWSNRKGVRERNIGWRIDYICIDARLASEVVGVRHQTEVYGSDHCPVELQWGRVHGRT